MGIVDIGHAIILFRQRHNAGQIGNVPVHGKHAVGNNQHLVVVRTTFLKNPFEIRHVAMTEYRFFRLGQPATVDNRRMIEFIGDNQIALIDYCLNCSGIAVESRLVNDYRFLFLKFSKQALQFFMQAQVPVNRTHRTCPNAVFLNGSNGRLLETRMIGKTQIIVGRKVDDLLAVNHAFRFVSPFQHLKRFIQAVRL